jgi:thioester reductase-like protein
MGTIFFTGFPGFLGAELLPRVLSRRSGDTALCLVQRKYGVLAKARADILEGRRPELRGRIRLIEGDIAQPGLGLKALAPHATDVVEVFHLAAAYDPMVRQEVGLAVNLEGTRHVLDFAACCGRLERFHHMSTCFVSGCFPGLFLESDLEKGQEFNNYYEQTKYLAEVEVRARMAKGLPGTIYRPAITVGDSHTGETQKFDGPYVVIQWLLRQPSRLAIMPTVGSLEDEVNLVPRDFVVGAVDALAGQPGSLGKTYQLADPRPLDAGSLLDHLAAATGRTILRIPFPLGVARFALDHLPGVASILRIPSASIDYFVHPTRYDTRNTQADLLGTGVACPPFTEYLPRLVQFFSDHPEISAEAMV